MALKGVWHICKHSRSPCYFFCRWLLTFKKILWKFQILNLFSLEIRNKNKLNQNFLFLCLLKASVQTFLEENCTVINQRIKRCIRIAMDSTISQFAVMNCHFTLCVNLLILVIDKLCFSNNDFTRTSIIIWRISIMMMAFKCSSKSSTPLDIKKGRKRKKNRKKKSPWPGGLTLTWAYWIHIWRKLPVVQILYRGILSIRNSCENPTGSIKFAI